jgi:hypothetical protein
MDTASGSVTAAGRFSAWLHRHRFVLLAAWLGHAFLLHYFVLGFVSWDGLTYRVPPMVELVQNGALGFDKYNQWAFDGYVPFIELLHVPFLYAFGLVGLIIGFPLVAFPLSVTAIYLLVRELTGNVRSATLGALAFAAVPLVNQQPFTGYVDFVVCALLAFFVYALLRLRSGERRWVSFVRLIVATAMFVMSRTQGLYVVIVLFPILAYATFFDRTGLRLRLPYRRELLIAVAAIAIGAIPSVAVQVMKYIQYGTPTYPMQFQLFGIKIGTGVSMKAYYSFAGIPSDDLTELGKSFVRGWVWHGEWPIGGFFDSRFLGGGVVLCVALVLLPFFLRTATRIELWLVAGCVLVSLLARDFAVPRYAYTLIVAITVVIGRGMIEVAAGRWRWLFWPLWLVLLAHFARAEIDVLQFQHDSFVAPRLNVAGSKHYLATSHAFEPYPDLDATLVIIDQNGNGFLLPMYGKKLSNRVLTTIPPEALGPTCAGLADVLARHPDALFVDDLDHTRACSRECVLPTAYGACLAYRVYTDARLMPPLDRPTRSVHVADPAESRRFVDGFRFAEGTPEAGFRWTVVASQGGAAGKPEATMLARLEPGRAYRATATVWGSLADQTLRVRVNDTPVLPATTLGPALSKQALSFEIPAAALAADGVQRVTFEFTGVNEHGLGVAVESIVFE